MYYILIHIIISIISGLYGNTITITRQLTGDRFSLPAGFTTCTDFDAKLISVGECVCQNSAGTGGTYLSENKGDNGKCFYDGKIATATGCYLRFVNTNQVPFIRLQDEIINKRISSDGISALRDKIDCTKFEVLNATVWDLNNVWKSPELRLLGILLTDVSEADSSYHFKWTQEMDSTTWTRNFKGFVFRVHTKCTKVTADQKTTKTKYCLAFKVDGTKTYQKNTVVPPTQTSTQPPTPPPTTRLIPPTTPPATIPPPKPTTTRRTTTTREVTSKKTISSSSPRLSKPSIPLSTTTQPPSSPPLTSIQTSNNPSSISSSPPLTSGPQLQSSTSSSPPVTSGTTVKEPTNSVLTTSTSSGDVGAVVGGVFGSLVLILFILCAVYFYVRHKKLKETRMPSNALNNNGGKHNGGKTAIKNNKNKHNNVKRERSQPNDYEAFPTITRQTATDTQAEYLAPEDLEKMNSKAEKPTVWIRMKRSFHGMAPSMNYRTEKPAPAPRPDRLKKESTNSNIMLTNQRKESHDVGTASPRKQSNDFGTLNARKYSHDVGLASPRKYSYDIGTTRKQSNDFGTLNARKYSHDVGSASPRKQSCDTGTISSRTSSSNSLEINQNNPRKHSSTSQDPMLDDSDQTQQKPQPQPRKKKYSDVAQRLPEIKEQKPKLKPVESTNQNIYSSLDETYKAESIYQEIGHNVTNPPGNNSGNFDTAKSHLGPPSNEAATTTYATPPVSRHQTLKPMASNNTDLGSVNSGWDSDEFDEEDLHDIRTIKRPANSVQYHDNPPVVRNQRSLSSGSAATSSPGYKDLTSIKRKKLYTELEQNDT